MGVKVLRFAARSSELRARALMDAMEPRVLFSTSPQTTQFDATHPLTGIDVPLKRADLVTDPVTDPTNDPPPVDPPPVDPIPVEPPPVDPPPVDPPPLIDPPHLAQDPNVQVFHIGPGEQYQTLDDVKWPGKKDAAVEFVLDSSDTPYQLNQRFIAGNVWIEPADWSNRPTLSLPETFKKSKKSSNLVAGNPTLNVIGTLTIRGMNTIGGENAVLLGSSKTGVIDCEDIRMLDGGGVWRGSGGQDMYFKDNEVLGMPRANVYSSYTYTVKHCVIDDSGTDVRIPQGGRFDSKGNAIGEAAIRIMDVDDLTLIHVKTAPWFYKPGKVWKQDVQLRPASKQITVIGCDLYLVDIGDMTWRKPAHKVDRVDFIDCTLGKALSLQPGRGVITLTNCTVAGQLVNKTM